MRWENELTRTLKIKYPVIQAPMLAVTTPEMVAAISNAGGLGSLPVGGLAPEKTSELIRKTKSLTTAPFAVNLFAHTLPGLSEDDFGPMQNVLEKICFENGFHFERQKPASFKFYSYAEQIEVLLEENIPVVSFTFGVLAKEVITSLKHKGVLLIGTATCIGEAKILDQAGIDMVTAQGIEAGGHRGTFLEDIPLPMIGSMSLIPQLSSLLSKPILAAGGINDGKTIKAALMLGASGVQIGTAFIGCHESAAIPSYKEAVQNAVDTDSILTRALSGRWARGLKNKFIDAIEKSGVAIPPYPVQASLVSPIRMEAQRNNNKEFIAAWAGQSSSHSKMKEAVEIFKEFIVEAEETG